MCARLDLDCHVAPVFCESHGDNLFASEHTEDDAKPSQFPLITEFSFHTRFRGCVV